MFKPNNLKQKYCSRGCSLKNTTFHKGMIAWNKGTKGIMKVNSGSFTSKGMSGQNHPMWRGGNKCWRGIGWRKLAKEIILEEEECQDCGRKDHLQVHHLIPFRYWQIAELANQRSNLITVCPSCHKKADWTVQSKELIWIQQRSPLSERV